MLVSEFQLILTCESSTQTFIQSPPEILWHVHSCAFVAIRKVMWRKSLSLQRQLFPPRDMQVMATESISQPFRFVLRSTLCGGCYTHKINPEAHSSQFFLWARKCSNYQNQKEFNIIYILLNLPIDKHIREERGCRLSTIWC